MHKGKPHFFFAALLAIVISAGALAALMSGCAGLLETAANDDPLTQSYKTLKSAAILYDEALTAAAELHQLGLIDDGQRDDVIAAGDDFNAAWRAAVAVLYASAQSDALDRANLEGQMVLFAAAYAEFRTAARPYLIKALAR